MRPRRALKAARWWCFSRSGRLFLNASPTIPPARMTVSSPEAHIARVICDTSPSSSGLHTDLAQARLWQLQNHAQWSSRSTFVPSWGQRDLREAPHSMQNFIPSGVSASQRGQRIDRLSCTAVRAAGGTSGLKPRYQSVIHANGMVCQYSRPTQVSSEKHEAAEDVGAEEEG
jgi:hypothetical protein